jgi:hypothetical protein
VVHETSWGESDLVREDLRYCSFVSSGEREATHGGDRIRTVQFTLKIVVSLERR